MTRVMRIDNEDVQVSVRRDGDRWRVSIDGRELPWPVGTVGDDVVVDTPDGRRRYAALVTPDACHVFCDGVTRTFALPDPDQDEATASGSAGPRLTADMPGKVVKVLVAVGDPVSAGQPLVIMESMKMETELAAAISGTVQTVAVEAGQVVGQGDLLVEILGETEDA